MGLVRDYIAKYDHDEIRFFQWYKGHGVDLKEVAKVIERIAIEDKNYQNGYELCHAVLLEVQKAEIERLLGPKPEVVWEQVKRTAKLVRGETWRWIRNLFLRTVTGIKRLLRIT